MQENNFYLINKPTGISSFDVIRQMRKKFNIRRMGHTGTLDPLATGLMLIATGTYTKLIPYFEKDTKSYTADIMLDGTTPSFDSETEILYLSEEKKEQFKQNLKKEDIKKILDEEFSGVILQAPPIYSALNIGGKKAYQLAREGVKIEMRKREATIFSIQILKYNYPLLVLDIKVSAGTYIRSIANELGETLGTGGYLSNLERTKIGKLDIKDSITLDDLIILNSLDITKILPEDKFIDINIFSEEEKTKLNNGLFFPYDFVDKKDGEFFVFNGNYITNIILCQGNIVNPKKKI